MKTKLRRALAELSTRADLKFQTFVRDPRVLAFVAASLNYASEIRLETKNLESEFRSLKARTELRMKRS